jgi:hypothetical protein
VALFQKKMARKEMFMRFEVLMAVTVKSTVFRDVTPCSLVEVYKRSSASIFRVKD